MDVKSLLRESRLIRFIKPGLGGPLIPDSHIKSLKEPLTDAIRTAVLNAFPSKDVKLNIVEAQTMAILYLEELEKTGNEKGLSSIEKYMKVALQHNPRGAFSVFVNYYIKQFDLDSFVCKSVRQMILYYLKTFSDMYPINAWQPHLDLFTVAKGLKYLSELFYRCGCDIDKLASELPLQTHFLSQAKMLQETIVTLFEDKKRSIPDKLVLLNPVFGPDKSNARFMNVLPRAISPILESLHPDQAVEIRRKIRNFAMEFLEDPRIHGFNKGRWLEVSEDGKQKFRALLARDDLDFFFDVAQKLDGSKMWDDRKKFWERYISYMTYTRAFFNSSATNPSKVNRLVKEYCERNGFTNIIHNWVQSTDNKCAFMFIIANYLIIEWTNNGYVTIIPYSTELQHLFSVREHKEKDLKYYLSYSLTGEVQFKHLKNWQGRVDEYMKYTVGVYPK
ncbi:MAG: hypothetical protein KA961_05755 [Bacteroides sp.]|nr:hypothetical protein [Bacteroides sp.]